MLRRSLLIVLILSLIVTGCWDRRELEDRDLVVAMAVDQVKQGLNLSVQVPIPANIVGSGGSGGGGGQQVQTFDSDGSTLAEALTRLERKMNKTVFLGYLELLLFGEEQAKSGINPFMDFMRREAAIQRKLFPVVVKGKAQRLLNNGTEMEQIQSIFINKLIEIGIDKETVMPIQLNDLLITLSTSVKQVPILNYVGLENGHYKWLGLAVFRRDRMVGVLQPDESVPLLQIRNQTLGQRIMVPCAKGRGKIQFTPLAIRRKIDVTQKPAIHIAIEVEGNVSEKTCKYVVGKGEKGEMIAIGEQTEKVYEQMANQLVRRSQKQLNLDIFELGNYVLSYHPGIYKKMNWEKEYPQIPIHVSYRVYVRRAGPELK